MHDVLTKRGSGVLCRHPLANESTLGKCSSIWCDREITKGDQLHCCSGCKWNSRWRAQNGGPSPQFKHHQNCKRKVFVPRKRDFEVRLRDKPFRMEGPTAQMDKTIFLKEEVFLKLSKTSMSIFGTTQQLRKETSRTRSTSLPPTFEPKR